MTDSRITATVSCTLMAIVRFWGRIVSIATPSARLSGTITLALTTPVPRPGSRSSMWLRTGKVFPRTISTAMIARNGNASAQPGCCT